MRILLLTGCLLATCSLGQDTGGVAEISPGSPQDDTSRVLGVIPANRIMPKVKSEEEPLTVRDKFALGFRDTVDPFTWVAAGFYAGVAQWQNDYPAFGQGAAGYAKRYGAAFADQAGENFMTEAIFPALLHQDPRYFRKGVGSWQRRLGYALTRTMITRTDSGASAVNYSELAGVAATSAISNLYYPAASRGVGESAEKFAIQFGSDSGFNVLIEFWPDIKHKILHRQ